MATHPDTLRRRGRSIASVLILAATLVSVVLLGIAYLVIARLYDDTVREEAEQVTALVTEQTFNAMYQLMSRGWERPDLEQFLAGLRDVSDPSGLQITIHRGAPVDARFGPIDQPPPDALVRRVFATGEVARDDDRGRIRHLRPLTAEDACLKCHRNSAIGEVLGVIEVGQDLRPLLRTARANLLSALLFLAPLPPLAALVVATLIGRRIGRGVRALREDVARVNKVSDLTGLSLGSLDTGFRELNEVMAELDTLRERVRGVAVDKELLEFEIRLLEGFVLTSDVVRDWREHVLRLLTEINRFIPVHALFTLFRLEDESVDLELFWLRPVSTETRERMEQEARKTLASNAFLTGIVLSQVQHQVADRDAPEVSIDPEHLALHTKSLLVDTPKIGGIVGIGLQVDLSRDPVRHLVVESILTTLLNVVGSVKAIAKYTHDLEYYATRDPLTDLYNQRIFWELLDYEIGRAERHTHQFGLLVVDLDNFKAINDTYGHGVGDRFLSAFARSVHPTLRRGDIFARYGGDEFVVLLPEVEGDAPYAAAERIRAVAEALRVDAGEGEAARSTASIGVAVFPEHGKTARDLFLFADHMMYRAKGEGKNRLLVPSISDALTAVQEASALSAQVRRAVELGLVEPHFQPIRDTRDGSVFAHEVLSRIRQDDGTLLGAGRFIELAERQGIVHQMDYVVMEKAFQEAARVGYRGLLFINVSPRALLLGEFFSVVRRKREQAGIPARQVVLELTERETVKNMNHIEDFVKRLRWEGYQFAIDDFGSGFSSFQYLKRFPIDYIKIEGEFIANMVKDERDLALVTSIAELAQRLRIRTVAEYVEDQEVADAVREAGIDFAQGFFLGRPSPTLVTDEAPEPETLA